MNAKSILIISIFLITIFYLSCAVKVYAYSDFPDIEKRFLLELKSPENWPEQSYEKKSGPDYLESEWPVGYRYEYKNDSDIILEKTNSKINEQHFMNNKNKHKIMPQMSESMLMFGEMPSERREMNPKHGGSSKEGPRRTIKRSASNALGQTSNKTETSLSGTDSLEDDSEYAKSMIYRMAFQYQFNIVQNYVFKYFKGPIESTKKYIFKNYKDQIDYSKNMVSKYSNGPTNYMEKIIARNFFKKPDAKVKLDFLFMPSIMEMRINY